MGKRETANVEKGITGIKNEWNEKKEWKKLRERESKLQKT